MNELNLNKFLIAFFQIWNDAVIYQKEVIVSKYGDSKSWADFMLGDRGVISRVSEILSRDMPIRCVKEWHKVDAFFVSGEGFFINDLTYPSKIHVMIEHENEDTAEEEMWKLIHWRSPLKVLILYDLMDSEKRTEKKKNWIENKLKNLIHMSEVIDDFNVESEKTEYLFLVGGRKNIDAIPTWKWASTKQQKLRELTSQGALDLSKEIAKTKKLEGANLPQEIIISLESNQPFEESISLHGSLHKKIDSFIDMVNQFNKQEDAALKLNGISISNMNKIT